MQARNKVPGQRAEAHDDQSQDENGYASDDEYDESDYDEKDYDEKDYDEKDYDEKEYDDDEADRDGQTTQNGAITAADAAQAALEQIAQLVPKQPEGVTAVEPADESWIVGVEVVEDRRIPSSADILATYEARIDADGTLVSYHRTKRYSRGRCDPGGGT